MSNFLVVGRLLILLFCACLLGQREYAEVPHELEDVCEQVRGDGGAVGLLEVELLDVGALVEAADGGHQHAVHVLLRPEPPRVLREEEDDVLHQLLPRQAVVARHLQRTEDLQVKAC